MITNLVLAGRRSLVPVLLLFALLAQFGCKSKPTVEVPGHVEPLPTAVSESREALPDSKTTTEPEQSAVVDVDEKYSIFFPLGSSTARWSEQEKLQTLAQKLKEDRGLSVTLVGHANDNGSRSFNLAVADARVESVSVALKKLGVKTQQIKKKIVGSEDLPRDCRSASCRQKMRRVDLFVATSTR